MDVCWTLLTQLISNLWTFALDSLQAEAYQWVEYFAGSRMATDCVRRAGYRTTSIDLEDYTHHGFAIGEGTCFDILSYSGFPLLSYHTYGDAIC